MYNMNEVQAYLKECGAFFIATNEGDQPRVRPFGVSEIINGRLYIMTGKVKDVFKQLDKNGKFEICAMKPSTLFHLWHFWSRVCPEADVQHSSKLSLRA